VRDLVKRDHPDNPETGSEEAWARLEEAKDLALASRTGGALVPIDAATALVRAATGQLAEREDRRDLEVQSERVVRQLVRSNVGRLKQRRRAAGLFAGVAAVVAFLPQTTFVRKIFNPYLTKASASRGTNLATAAGLVFASCIAVFAWILHERARAVEQAIEDAGDTLDDRGSIFDVLYEISERGGGLTPPWTMSELERALGYWIDEAFVSPRRHRINPLLRLSRVLTNWMLELRITFSGNRSLASVAWIVGPHDFLGSSLRRACSTTSCFNVLPKMENALGLCTTS